MRQLTESETRERARKEAVSISDLIHPSDVADDADEWSDIDDERLRQEIGQSLDIIMSEMGYHHELKALVHDRALSILIEDMPRVPLDDLKYQSLEQAIKAGYWPNSTPKGELQSVLQEHYQSLDTFHWDVIEEAEIPVREGLMEGMKP